MFDDDCYNEDIAKDTIVENLYVDVTTAIMSKDITNFENLLLPSNYPKLDKDEIEQFVFDCTYSYIGDNEVNIELFLDHLIFEHKITRKNAFTYVKPGNHNKESIALIEKMFATRDLRKDLIIELNTQEKFIKQVKL